MKLQKLRWSRVYESSEEELIDLLTAKNIKSTRLHIDEMSNMIDVNFVKDTTWWCVDGSMSVTSDTNVINLQAGDFVHIPANSIITAKSGIIGCTYYKS